MTFRRDTVVNMKAVPVEGWLFDKWIGPVKDNGSVSTTVTMDKNVDVTAFFLEADEVIEEPGPVKVILTIGFPVITITENGTERTVTADTAAQIVNGRTYLPLRAVGEIFSATFDWGPKESNTEWVSLMLK